MVFREENKVNYTKISNELFKDKELSLSAKGLLITMLSLPDKWNYSTLGLASIVKESKNTIHRLLKELEDHKYLIRKSIRDDKGKFIRFDYFIYELPCEPYPNIRDMELPDMDYSDIINKINNKDEYDKTLLSGFTNELIRRDFITENDFNINRYKELFNESNKVYDYELIYNQFLFKSSN